MNEERVFQETENIIEEATSMVEPVEAGNNRLVKTIVVGGTILTVGAVALAMKNRDKIRNWRIARTEKKLAKLKERQAEAEAKSPESTETIEVDATEIE